MPSLLASDPPWIFSAEIHSQTDCNTGQHYQEGKYWKPGYPPSRLGLYLDRKTSSALSFMRVGCQRKRGTVRTAHILRLVCTFNGSDTALQVEIDWRSWAGVKHFICTGRWGCWCCGSCDIEITRCRASCLGHGSAGHDAGHGKKEELGELHSWYFDLKRLHSKECSRGLILG